MPTTRTRVMDQSTDRSTMNSTASQLALKMDFTNPGLAVLHVSGALDTATGEEIGELLLDLNSSGQTLILVTHNPDLAARYARRVIQLVDGSVAGDAVTGARR